MKKLDIVVFTFVLVIGGLIFGLYFRQININVHNAALEISFKNIVLDSVQLTEDTHIVYYLDEIDEHSFKFTKDVYIDDQIYRTEETHNANLGSLKTLNPNHILHHKIVVTWDDIRMEEASCPNKDCQRMKMSHRATLPIVCTNGVVVRFVLQEIEIIV